MSASSNAQTEDARAALSEFLVQLESHAARSLSKLVNYTHGDVQFQFGTLAQLLQSGDFMSYLNDHAEHRTETPTATQFRVFYDLYLLKDLLNKTPLPELILLLQIVHSDNVAQRISRIEGVHGVLTQLGPAAITEIHNALSEPAGTPTLCTFTIVHLLLPNYPVSLPITRQPNFICPLSSLSRNKTMISRRWS